MPPLTHYLLTNQWSLLFSEETCEGMPPAMRYRTLHPGGTVLWADPFVAVRNGRRFMLFEECPYRFWGRTTGSLGVLRAMEYLGGGHWGPVKTILEREYHLSYPFPFEWRGGWYLLPETMSNGTVELYEAEEFPWRWRLCRTVMRGVRAVDTTLFHHQGLWWMFTCREDSGPPNRDLYLYSTDDPVEGEWTPHPGNPVVSDVRFGRMAGGVFRHGGGWVRPAQDCSRGYGGAVEFRRIVRFDEREYFEEAAGRLGPESVPGAQGIHTFNHKAGLTVADARRRVGRWRLC